MDLAVNLTEQFAIRHTLLDYPYKVNFTVTKNISMELNSHLRQPWNNRFKPDRPLYIQPIEVVPTGGILFKCVSFDLKKARKEVNNLQPFKNSERFLAFEERLRSDYNSTMRMMEAFPCLRMDFQLIVNKYSGGITHLDFERCSQSNPDSYRDDSKWKCADTFEKFVDSIISIRRGHGRGNASKTE